MQNVKLNKHDDDDDVVGAFVCKEAHIEQEREVL